MVQQLIAMLKKEGVENDQLRRSGTVRNAIAISGETEEELKELGKKIEQVGSVRRYFEKPRVDEGSENEEAGYPFKLVLGFKR